MNKIEENDRIAVKKDLPMNEEEKGEIDEESPRRRTMTQWAFGFWTNFGALGVVLIRVWRSLA